MPTTPHPASHSASSEGKEFTINTSADRHPEAEHGDEPATAAHRDEGQCPCGALADRNGLCRKCRARALWERRQAHRERRALRRPSSSRRADRDSRRPHGRRPGR